MVKSSPSQPAKAVGCRLSEVPGGEGEYRNDEAGDRTAGGEVEEHPAIREMAAEDDDRPQRTRQGQGEGDEIGERRPQAVPAGCEVVPEFVCREEAEEGDAEP